MEVWWNDNWRSKQSHVKRSHTLIHQSLESNSFNIAHLQAKGKHKKANISLWNFRSFGCKPDVAREGTDWHTILLFLLRVNRVRCCCRVWTQPSSLAQTKYGFTSWDCVDQSEDTDPRVGHVMSLTCKVEHTRSIMMGEGSKQPPLCWLPLWVVELGFVAESCQHTTHQLINSLEQANHSLS